MRVVKDLLVRDMKSDGVAQRLTGTEVAGVARVGAARHDHADTMAPAIAVSCGPKVDFYAVGPIAQRAGTMWANPEVAVADVRALALGINIAKDQKKVGVFETRAKIQFRGHGADDIEVGAEGLAGIKQDI